ncbi:hypothetical protein Godav_001360, partial [Gossypium davidsonii]|nr:hypothetical protein [Gossypium davidsonii]MBA0668459.1 hypothetical protein [Gossypium klotzschianum]
MVLRRIVHLERLIVEKCKRIKRKVETGGLSLEAGGLGLSRRRMQSKSLAEIEGQTKSKNLGETVTKAFEKSRRIGYDSFSDGLSRCHMSTCTG